MRWEAKSGLPVIADGPSLAHAPSHPSEAPAVCHQIGQNSFSRLSALTHAGKPPRPAVRLPCKQRERFAKKAMGYRSPHYTRTIKR